MVGDLSVMIVKKHAKGRERTAVAIVWDVSNAMTSATVKLASANLSMIVVTSSVPLFSKKI